MSHEKKQQSSLRQNLQHQNLQHQNLQHQNLPAIATALWYEARETIALRAENLGTLQPGTALVRTLCSYISRGTERLVFEGNVPESVFVDMRAPLQEGAFPFPVKYGYSVVGEILASHADALEGESDFENEDSQHALQNKKTIMTGTRVFALAPHQDFFIAPLSMLHPVPSNVPDARASLAANMETALTAIWDSGVSLGDRIVVIGAGMIGLLIGYLANAMPGTHVTVVDPQTSRADIAAKLGLHFLTPDDFRKANTPQDKADCVFHCSAQSDGLTLALECAGTEAKIIEVSWYGARDISLSLGAQFHSQRLSLIASQVGAIPPARLPRWDHARRLKTALKLLENPALDCLIGQHLAFTSLPKTLPMVFSKTNAKALGTIIDYRS